MPQKFNFYKYFHTPNTMLSVYEYTEIHLCAESYVLKAYFDETVWQSPVSNLDKSLLKFFMESL